MARVGDDAWVHLSLDGQIFCTTRATLAAEPDSLLARMFSSPAAAASLSIAQDFSHPARPYLLDRSPRTFGVILSWLRSGRVILDPAVPAEAVRCDAEYYGLCRLAAALRPPTPPPPAPDADADMSRKQIVAALAATPSNRPLRLQGLRLAGVDLAGLDLSAVNLRRCDLRGARLCDATLSGADLSAADLSGADLRRCVLEGAVLRGARLDDAVLSHAVCRGAVFVGASLRRATLQEADLTTANFDSAILQAADVSGSRFASTSLRGANLDGVQREGSSLAMGGAILASA